MDIIEKEGLTLVIGSGRAYTAAEWAVSLPGLPEPDFGSGLDVMRVSHKLSKRRRRMFRCTGVTALVVAVGCVAGLAGQTAVAQSKSGEKRARASAIKLLDKRVEKIDWVDTPFEEVIAWIRAEGDERINVIPRWNVLSDESVDRDTLVNLQLTDSTVAEILNETIEQLSESSEIGYRAHSNRITISTKADFGRKLELVVYDASDILFRVEDMGQEAPQIDLQQTSGGGGSGGGGWG